MEKLRVGIIFGGMSSEKEVSLNSGRNVYDNMDREQFEPVPVFMEPSGRLWVLPWQLISQNTTTDISERLATEAERIAYEDLKGRIDFAFIALHGKYGDDGCIQGLLELLNIPYTGPGILASAIGMDKDIQQKILRAEGLGVPMSTVVGEREWRENPDAVRQRLIGEFGFPLVTKPVREGSSIGVTVVRKPEGLDAAMASALEWDRAVLVEEFLDGTEFSCIVLEDERGTPAARSDGNPSPERVFLLRRQVHAGPLPEIHAAQDDSEGCVGEDQGRRREGLQGFGLPLLRPDRRLRPQGRPGPHHGPELLVGHGALVLLLRAGRRAGDAARHDRVEAHRDCDEDPQGEEGTAVTPEGRQATGNRQNPTSCQPTAKEGKPKIHLPSPFYKRGAGGI